MRTSPSRAFSAAVQMERKTPSGAFCITLRTTSVSGAIDENLIVRSIILLWL